MSRYASTRAGLQEPIEQSILYNSTTRLSCTYELNSGYLKRRKIKRNIFKTLIVVISLLCSVQAMACDIYVTVKNDTGVTLKNIIIKGPWRRVSPTYTLLDGQTHERFNRYHAYGDMENCHGKYWLDSGSGAPHCDMGATTEDEVTINKDGEVILTILKEKNGNACKVVQELTYY
ncbi:MAG: hypothetical protein GY777_25035 [Candidatus Brocadiaceae bacterium]|nr:hypothetical protein [Candidatus Brocadiaceae bacterium]